MFISIVLITFNRKKELIQAITSVSNQSHNKWKLLIIDDGSAIDIKILIQDFLKDDRIKYFKKENGGPASARNFGIVNCSENTEIICFLDDDDTLHPEYLYRINNTFKKKPEIGFLWTGVNYCKPNGTKQPFLWSPNYPDKETAYNSFLRERYVGTGYGLAARREVFDDIGGFDEDMKAVEDTDWFLRVISKYEFTVLPQYLVNINWDSAKDGVNAPSINKLEGLIKIFNKYKLDIMSDRLAFRNICRKIGLNYYLLSDHKNGRKWMLKGFINKIDFRFLYYWVRYEWFLGK